MNSKFNSLVLISDMWKIWEGKRYFLLKLYGYVVIEKESGSRKIRIPTEYTCFKGEYIQQPMVIRNLEESHTKIVEAL